MTDVVTHQPRPTLRGQLSETGYDLPEGLSFDEWAAEGPTLVQMARSAMWWVGDWLRYGERRFGERYTQAVEATGYAVQTLKNAQWVCDKIPRSERRPDLDFGHHEAVAGIPEPAQRREVLDRVVREGLTVRETRNIVRDLKADPGSPPRPEPEPELTLEERVHAALEALDKGITRRQWHHIEDARRHVAAAESLLDTRVPA